MTPRFLQVALPFVLQAEGGYSDTPGDNGGATNFGIIQSEYDAYRTDNGLPAQSVRDISQEEVQTIYYNNYWEVGHCEGLPAPLDVVMFDTCVNEGPGEGFKNINQVFGIASDTREWLPATSDAAHHVTTPYQDAQAFINLRIAFYNFLADNEAHDEQFRQGWLNRMAALKSYCGL